MKVIILGSTLTNYPVQGEFECKFEVAFRLIGRVRVSDFFLGPFAFVLQSIDPLGLRIDLLEDILNYGKYGPDRSPLCEIFTSLVLDNTETLKKK